MTTMAGRELYEALMSAATPDEVRSLVGEAETDTLRELTLGDQCDLDDEAWARVWVMYIVRLLYAEARREEGRQVPDAEPWKHAVDRCTSARALSGIRRYAVRAGARVVQLCCEARMEDLVMAAEHGR